MIKTIKVKTEMNFRELMEYIIQNDVSGEFKSDDVTTFSVNANGEFKFHEFYYDDGETYEVDVEEEITEDTIFGTLVEIFDEHKLIIHHSAKVKDIVVRDTNNIYALINGELKLVWERE